MSAALLVIDVQTAFDQAEFWGRRNNPECEANIALLLGAWDGTRVYVRHDSDEPGSPLAPDSPGNAFKDVISGVPDLLVTKQTNSAFYGEPDLHAWLQARGIDSLVICGITTDHCVETRTRMAGNLVVDCRWCSTPSHSATARPGRGGRHPAG